jgi:hypothetical protein
MPATAHVEAESEDLRRGRQLIPEDGPVVTRSMPAARSSAQISGTTIRPHESSTTPPNGYLGRAIRTRWPRRAWHHTLSFYLRSTYEKFMSIHGPAWSPAPCGKYRIALTTGSSLFPNSYLRSQSGVLRLFNLSPPVWDRAAYMRRD